MKTVAVGAVVKRAVKEMNINNRSSAALQRASVNSERRTELIKKFGGPVEFANRFSPDIQWKLREIGADYAVCCQMEYPTMWEVREVYGVDCLRDWVAVMVENLNDFCNVRDKMKDDQKDEAAHIISCEYGQLNIAEVALFFLKVKSGTFGEFYGILDTVRLMSIMKKFMAERTKALALYYDAKRKEDEQKERERWEREAVPPETVQKWIQEGRFNNLFSGEGLKVV